MATVEFGVKGAGHTSRIEGLTLKAAIALASELRFTFGQHAADTTRRPSPERAKDSFVNRPRAHSRFGWEDCHHWITVIR